jgi:hypothetical protein
LSVRHYLRARPVCACDGRSGAPLSSVCP